MIGKKIKSIDFELLSPDLLRKMSTIRIVTPDTYDDDGYPIEGGLMDPKLGVIDPGLRCKTCGGGITSCSGHFGHIELIRPVVHIGYVKMVLTLLKTTCRKCGRILLEPSQIERYRALMLKEEREEEEEKTIDVLEKTKKATKCPHCSQKQEPIKLLKPTTFYEGDQRLLPTQIRERLERIQDHDLKMLGINYKVARPEWAILTVLPVPPVTTRPSITLETGERSEDDLTHKLVDVLRINQRLSDNISAGAPQLIVEDLWDLLQYHATTYFNNEVSGIPAAKHRSGRPLKTLFQRLKGKEGRFRYYLSGKRVNFSARTVISPDPCLSISEVGVPFEIARELTVPEYVNDWNLEEMKELVKRKEYPAANYIIRIDGKRKKVSDLNREEILTELVAGYVIERQLKDGDTVIFNRQPSLHRPSMMAHTVKVLPGKTFRMNDAVSDPYNADYDGDEMNLHVPQTEEARVEVDSLMRVQNHIISIANGRPIMGPHQDHVSGAFLMTRSNTMFTKEEALFLMGKVGINELPRSKDGMYDGKEVFSMVIPNNINLQYRSGLCRKCGTCDGEKCLNDAYITIEKGRIKSGAMDGRGLQRTLLKEVYMKDGPEVAKKFIDDVTRLTLAAIMIKGFTISVSDLDLSPKAVEEVNTVLDSASRTVDELIEQYKRGELERVPGKTMEETLEDRIMAELGKARDRAGRAAERDLGKSNFALLMSRSGAKGSAINVTQMSACVGQTAMRGKRILRGYRNKTLPHFKDGDISAKARGFIKNSFRNGFTPVEYFFHSMSGRDALVDKGVRTSKSGYMQRRLINALLDISLRSDRSARDSAGNVVQFLYGEDGLNPIYSSGSGTVDVKKHLE
jgi:DNA-directed RNA polymerase subunit A'